MKRILIVDDEPMTLKIMGHYLTLQGYETTIASDGYIAIEEIEKHKFDLIITDIMMPDLSGLSLLSLLKTYYLDKTPIILISSLDQGELVLQSLGLGAEDFFVKPIDLSFLSERIKTLLAPAA